MLPPLCEGSSVVKFFCKPNKQHFFDLLYKRILNLRQQMKTKTIKAMILVQE